VQGLTASWPIPAVRNTGLTEFQTVLYHHLIPTMAQITQTAEKLNLPNRKHTYHTENAELVLTDAILLKQTKVKK